MRKPILHSNPPLHTMSPEGKAAVLAIAEAATKLLASERCETCRFWLDRAVKYDDSVSGECHRNPPAMVVKRSACATWTDTGWHRTASDNWCGEYQKTPADGAGA